MFDGGEHALGPDDTIPERPPEALHPPVAEMLRTGFVRNDIQFVTHPDDADAWQDLIDSDQIVMAQRRGAEHAQSGRSHQTEDE